MALPRTPLAPDPGYEHSSNFYASNTYDLCAAKGRVRPEALDIARLHTAGTLSELLCYQQQDFPPRPRYRSQKPKDHARENVRRIRQIQSLHSSSKARGERGDQQQGSSKCLPLPGHKNPKYDSVPSKVITTCAKHSAHSGPGDGGEGEEEEGEGETKAGRRVRLQSPDGTKSRRNFMLGNIHAAGQHRVTRAPAQEHLQGLRDRKERDMTEYKRGTVPQYLKERQTQWVREEEERLASLPDPSVPPGHTLLPTKDRLEMLRVLNENHRILTKELLSLPIRTDTLRARNRRAELEVKLAEIDDAIKIFSKSRVLIRE